MQALVQKGLSTEISFKPLNRAVGTSKTLLILSTLKLS